MEDELANRGGEQAPSESPFGTPRQILTDWLLFGLPYLVAGVLCLLLLPSAHGASAVGAPAAAVLFIVALQFELRVSVGWLACNQAAFVLLLFTLPLNVVPLAAYGCLTVAQLIKRRKPLALLGGSADCWYTVPPTVILALAAKGSASWSHWPIYVAAFVGQLVLAEALQAVRFGRVGHRLQAREELTAMAVDAMLTPIGLIAAVSIRPAPGASIAALAGVTGLLALLGAEHKERRSQTVRALRDPLTGLANRALFGEAMAACGARCRRNGVEAGLLLLDLDNFKRINDTHGHHSGDEVLLAFAERLRAGVRAVDTAARIGGDEFAVILAEPITVEGARAAAAKLREAVSQPMTLSGGVEVEILASIGFTMFDGAAEVPDVVASADRALYESKRAGKDADQG